MRICSSVTKCLSPLNNQGLSGPQELPPSPHWLLLPGGLAHIFSLQTGPEVETLAEAPALHVAEDHGRQDENEQRPQCQEEGQAQGLQQLEVGEPLSPLGRPVVISRGGVLG